MIAPEALPACRQIVELVTDYLEGALAPDDREAFELHVVVCDGCSSYLEQMRWSIRTTKALLDDLCPETLAGLVAAFGELVARRADVSPVGRRAPDLAAAPAPAAPPSRPRLAYKFLGCARRNVLSGFTWPLGTWVEVAPPLAPTWRGVHACRPGDLPYWIGEELWLAELRGDVIEQGRCLVASEGRLVERLESWPAAARRFAEVCSERDRGFGPAEPAAGWAPVAGPAYVAAHGAGVEAVRRGGSYERGFADERAWQARWLAERLDLPAA